MDGEQAMHAIQSGRSPLQLVLGDGEALETVAAASEGKARRAEVGRVIGALGMDSAHCAPQMHHRAGKSFEELQHPHPPMLKSSGAPPEKPQQSGSIVCDVCR